MPGLALKSAILFPGPVLPGDVLETIVTVRRTCQSTVAAVLTMEDIVAAARSCDTNVIVDRAPEHTVAVRRVDEDVVER